MKESSVSFSFTSQLSNLKNTLVLWEDVVSKTVKLNSSLRSVIQCIAGFLEAFQRVADSAYTSNCGLRELGSSMTRFCLRERGLESRLRTFNSQLLDCLASPLADRLEEWRRSVAQLDRENNKEGRRARSELQRVSCEVDRLNRRFRRKASVSAQADQFNSQHTDIQTSGNVQLNFMQNDLELKQRTLADLERTNLRRAVVEERRRFAELITCLKPVLDSQLALLSDVSSIEECTTAITKYTIDPNDLPSDTEQAVDEAVERVSTRSHLQQRKMSDVRAAMRFARSTLSGHGSRLSLQSVLSSSTTDSWNRISAPLNGDRPVSPAFVGHTENPPKPPATPNCAPSTSGDSVSLFESSEANGDLSHIVDTQRAGIGVATVRNQCYAALDYGPSNCNYSPGLTATENAQVKALDDQDEDDNIGDTTGGATTEDTEDAETEDEDHLLASELGQPKSILYPNQAIPAPVYTNLHELKKAAAKKFSQPDGSLEPTSTPFCNPTDDLTNSTANPQHLYSIDFPAPVLPALDPSLSLTNDGSMFFNGRSQPSASEPITEYVHISPSDSVISTCITSGTSTFRRKQVAINSGEMGNVNPQDSSVMDSPHGSFTPALVRRSAQVSSEVNERETGRCRTRPANPPRRSSSVSRDLTRSPHSDLNRQFAPHPLHAANGIDPSIQRVTSTIFTYPDTPSRGQFVPMNNRSTIVDASQYASVSVSKLQNSSAGRVPDRISPMPRLTPPPLATNRAPSKTGHPCFGVKVLPSQTLLPTGSSVENPSYYTGRSGPRSLIRQSSCENRFNRAQQLISSHYSQQQADVVRDDAITSFID